MTTTQLTPYDRFMDKVELAREGRCWLWTGAVTSGGYGNFWSGERNVPAHRWSYEYFIGLIPDGLQLDHVKAWGCTTTLCVNPAHLEPVTQQVNLARGNLGCNYSDRTHCAHGHEFTPENTRSRADGGGRRCLTCSREQGRVRMRNRRQALRERGTGELDLVVKVALLAVLILVAIILIARLT